MTQAVLVVTAEDCEPVVGTDATHPPGLIRIWGPEGEGGEAIALHPAPAIELGRATLGGLLADDSRISRRHADVEHQADGWCVIDHGSRNGTFVDGVRVRGRRTFAAPRLLRVGHTLFRFVDDVSPFEDGGVVVRDGEVLGPSLREARGQIARIASVSRHLLITGASGTGKELAAATFHAAGPRRRGPFVPVNCAAIPEGLAERLLFGTRRGAYSGAGADADGFAQSAAGGTLFLDEVAELSPSVQAKLLRLLESGEVQPLGSSRPQRVDVGVCAATHRDLAAAAAAGRFREDLYYRLGRPQVSLPRLRDRMEEIPHLIALTLRDLAGLQPHPLFVERAALRAWPGNCRELVAEVRRAAAEALAEGRTIVMAEDLAPGAGEQLPRAQGPARADGAEEAGALRLPGDQTVEHALATAKGNVTRAARELGVHRNQLRRWLAKRESARATLSDSDGE